LCEQLASGPGRSVEARELLYTMGQPAESVYLVRRGLVKTSLVSPGGQELTLRLYPAGDILGELCLCTGVRREQVVTLETSEVVEIPLTALLRRLRQIHKSHWSSRLRYASTSPMRIRGCAVYPSIRLASV